MPNGAAAKVKKRAEKAARLLRMRGCITTSAVMEMGYSKTQAESALKYLTSAGRAVRVRVGRISLWCCSGKSAARHVERLRRALHALICAAGVKYVSPRDSLELIMRDRAARSLFSRYIKLGTNSAALNFLAALLESVYGRPAFRKRRGSMPVYFAECRRLGGA
jgi:hypothetical protein